MARPRKDYKVSKNGESFQCFIGDRYVGSISVKKLCLLLDAESPKKHNEVKPQLPLKSNGENKEVSALKSYNDILDRLSR